MTQDEVFALAQKAGFKVGVVLLQSGDEAYKFAQPHGDGGCLIELRRFAALVAASEREAVAYMVEHGAPPPQEHGNRVEVGGAARRAYAAAIRARGGNV